MHKMGTETHIDLHVKCPLLLSDYRQNWNVPKILLTLPNIKFNKNPHSRSQVISCIHTDGQRDFDSTPCGGKYA
jgi:hypothetical protein